MQALELEVGNTKVGQFRVAVDKNKLPSADMYYYASEAYRNWCHGQPHCWMISDALGITCTTWVLVESGREVLLTQSYLVTVAETECLPVLAVKLVAKSREI